MAKMVPVETLQSILEDPSKGSNATQYFPVREGDREAKLFVRCFIAFCFQKSVTRRGAGLQRSSRPQPPKAHTCFRSFYNDGIVPFLRHKHRAAV